MNNNNSMMTPADFRAYAGTTALRRGFNGKQPRTRTIALTHTLVTRADGTQYVIPANTHSRKSRTNKTATTAHIAHRNHVTNYNLPSIHT